MEILDKKQLEKKLGKFGIFSGEAGNAIVSQVNYLGGITAFDNLIEEEKVDLRLSNAISFEMRPKGIDILLIHGLNRSRIGLYKERVNFWAFEPQVRIKERKSKSVVGRALVGGILLGPVGAIVGGMTGIGEKEITKSIKGIDNILSISYTDLDDNEHLLLFSCSDKKAKKVLNYFTKNFPNKYQEELMEEIDQVENKQESVADELIKLKSLLDEGLITREEFNDQKRKLLGSK